MPSFPVRKARRSKRVVLKRRAGLVINLDRKPNRLPCLALDSSKKGFRLRGSFDLRRGQVVELILDEDMPTPGRCSVVQVDKAGTKHEGEAALETVQAIIGHLPHHYLGSGHEKDLHNSGRLLPLLEIQTPKIERDHLSVSTVCSVASWSQLGLGTLSLCSVLGMRYAHPLIEGYLVGCSVPPKVS